MNFFPFGRIKMQNAPPYNFARQITEKYPKLTNYSRNINQDLTIIHMNIQNFNIEAILRRFPALSPFR
jgi:hypothetical protein